jgi:(p)ppGpp synthase/HD superfamily hydrolase
MNKTELIDISAKTIAQTYHLGQVDRGGHDYFSGHLTTVVKYVKFGYPNDKDYENVAWLHDILEDTPCTVSDLQRFGFSKEVIDAVVILTKCREVPYKQYLQNIKNNQLARVVKICDIHDNMRLCRLPKITNSDLERNKRYQSALNYLIGENNV